MKNLIFPNAVLDSDSGLVHSETAHRSSLLEVKRLSVERSSKRLLHDLQFQVRSGEFVAVIGANGAGKSTLVRAVTGEWDASGEIRLFGCSLGVWTRKKLATRMAVMSQKTHLDFAFTARQVVEMGRLPHTQFSATHNSKIGTSTYLHYEFNAHQAAWDKGLQGFVASLRKH